MMIDEIERRRSELAELCRRFGASRLELFGSAVAGGLTVESDLDFLVEFESYETGYADRYFGLLESLEELLERPVDLVVSSSIRNPFFREAVDQTRAIVYAA